MQALLADTALALQAEAVDAGAACRRILRRDWLAPDGRARMEVAPRGDKNDNDNLRRFTDAVRKIAPEASGAPISILESGDTVVRAFFQAGIMALASISVLLWLALRRIGDVALTLAPLLLAGVMTMEICVLIDLPLNFANIIALPLLLGLGVAFKIYYVMAWRAGSAASAANQPDAGDLLFRDDHGDGLRQPVDVQSIRARRAWASCWRFRWRRRSARRCSSSRR